MTESADLPKIWFSRALDNTDGSYSIDHDKGTDVVPFAWAYRDIEPSPSPDAIPTCLFQLGASFKPRSADAAMVLDGFIVVSEKMRDVLTQFNLGSTQFYECPIYASHEKTAVLPGRYAILHVMEKKSAFVPEASENVHQGSLFDDRPVIPGEPWKPTYGKDILAVRAAATEGVDLWADPDIKDRLFATDRLKPALDKARVKTRVLTFVPARVLA
ncbi:MAG: hypothetical protein AAFV86_04120 [Pseudomonadota bacterium]